MSKLATGTYWVDNRQPRYKFFTKPKHISQKVRRRMWRAKVWKLCKSDPLSDGCI